MASAISTLEWKLWDACVDPLFTSNESIQKRWDSDLTSYWSEAFRVRPLPTYLEPLVEPTLAEWKKVEDYVFSEMKISREQFLEEFEAARDNFQSGGDQWTRIVPLKVGICRGAVRNMDTVKMFAWVLPAADMSRREELRRIGRTVVAIFYTEQFVFCDEGRDPNNKTFQELEFRWKQLKEDSDS